MTTVDTSALMERVLATNDLSRLTPDERNRYYLAVCESVGVNPLTHPFEFIQLNGKLTLYTKKNCTDQLRSVHKVSIYKVDQQVVDGVMTVTAYARKADGQEDVDIGAVDLKGLTGEKLANKCMVAITKAKRRVTLSICGLSFLDESEVDSVPGARPMPVEEDPKQLEASLEQSLALAKPKTKAEARTAYKTVLGANIRPARKEKLLSELKARAAELPE